MITRHKSQYVFQNTALLQLNPPHSPAFAFLPEFLEKMAIRETMQRGTAIELFSGQMIVAVTGILSPVANRTLLIIVCDFNALIGDTDDITLIIG